MKKSASLKDIAEKVGVSIPLVSYVISGKEKENRVSEETAKRIREVAKELNYHPNLNARSLKTNKTRTIGVILADISNTFFSNVARIIEDEAFLNEYTVIFGSSDENLDKFEKVLNFLITRQVDGLIIAAPQSSNKIISSLKDSGIPFVLIDRYFQFIDTNYVNVNNFDASLQATKYLISRGNKKIAAIKWDSTLAHYEDRYLGYLESLKSNGFKINENLVREIRPQSFSNDMKRSIKDLVLNENVDAIYFQTNTLATEGLLQMKNLDKDLITKLDLIAFDENLAFSFLERPIPYVAQPLKKMGKKAVEILLDSIEKKGNKIKQVSFKAKLCNT